MELHTGIEIGIGIGTGTEYHGVGLPQEQGTTSTHTSRPINATVSTATSKTGDDEIGQNLIHVAEHEVDHPQQGGYLIERGTVVDRIASLCLPGNRTPHGAMTTVANTIMDLTWLKSVSAPVVHNSHD